MLYSIAKPITTIALKVFFKKIYLSNADRLPRDKPVLLAANHPTAFLEPCILACFLDRPLYFLVRGDLFVKPFYTKLLNDLHMLPVYRAKDRGYAFLKQNYETFDACYDSLRQNQIVMILAEGHTVWEKRLRPLKKGTARLAFGALEKYPELEDIYIIPTGVNFTYADRFRSDIMIDIGEPILARDFLEEYKANPTTGINSLTEVLRRAMEDRIVIVENPEDDTLAEHLFILDRSHRPVPWLPVFSFNGAPLQAEINAANIVNKMTDEDKQSALQATKIYFSELKKYQLDDLTLVTNRPKSNFFASILLLIGFIPFALGYLLNAGPLLLAKSIAGKKVKHIEFYSPVMVAIGMVLYLIYFILWAILLPVFGPGWWSFLVFAIPLLGGWALFYREFYHEFAQKLKYNRLNEALKTSLSEKRKLAAAWLGTQTK